MKQQSVRLSWLRQLVIELPKTLVLTVLTGVVTLLLLIVVSAVVGTDNAEHRVSQRCSSYYEMTLLREIVLSDDQLRERIDLNDYPVPDISGIDCMEIFRPLEPAEIP